MHVYVQLCGCTSLVCVPVAESKRKTVYQLLEEKRVAGRGAWVVHDVIAT